MDLAPALFALFEKYRPRGIPTAFDQAKSGEITSCPLKRPVRRQATGYWRVARHLGHKAGMTTECLANEGRIEIKQQWWTVRFLRITAFKQTAQIDRSVWRRIRMADGVIAGRPRAPGYLKAATHSGFLIDSKQDIVGKTQQSLIVEISEPFGTVNGVVL